MKARIQAILQEEKLTATQFADKIGVQRSSVSHILSGRNNPSVDFVTKILKGFPKIDSEWLVLGNGNMKKNITPDNIVSVQDNYDNMDAKPKPVQSNEKTLWNDDYSPKPEQQHKVNEKLFTEHKTSAPKDKKVEKIVVFYSDKTFSEYHSE